MVKLFISYKRGTAAIAPLRQALRKARYTLWYDKADIHTGQDWQKAIDAGIDSADGVIVGLTPDACDSEYVQYEVQRARSQGKPIFPIKVESIRDDDLAKLGIGHLHFIDFTGPGVNDWDQALQRLFDDLEKAGLKITLPPLWKIIVTALLLIALIGGGGFLAISAINARNARLDDPQALNVTQLTGRQIRDIASGGEVLWLATDEGLAQYNLSSRILTYIPDTKDIQSLATSADGQRVWFGFSDAGKSAVDGKALGYYDAVTKQIERLTPVGDRIPPLATTILTLVYQDADTLWIGTQSQGVYVYHPERRAWEHLPDRFEGQDRALPLDAARIAILAGESSAQSVVWFTNQSILFRWQPGRTDWTYFSFENTGLGLGRYIGDVAVDRFGHLWVAHEDGISILPAASARTDDKSDDEGKWTRCNAGIAPLPKGAVQRIIAARNGIWLVTDSGVAYTPSAASLSQCKDLPWRVWNRPDSYTGAFGGRYRLAVSERPIDGNPEYTLWIAKFASDKVDSLRLKD